MQRQLLNLCLLLFLLTIISRPSLLQYLEVRISVEICLEIFKVIYWFKMKRMASANLFIFKSSRMHSYLFVMLLVMDHFFVLQVFLVLFTFFTDPAFLTMFTYRIRWILYGLLFSFFPSLSKIRFIVINWWGKHLIQLILDLRISLRYYLFVFEFIFEFGKVL